jgi:hypothetical protein
VVCRRGIGAPQERNAADRANAPTTQQTQEHQIEPWILDLYRYIILSLAINSKDYEILRFSTCHAILSRALGACSAVYNATPFHRDPLKELALACARHQMKFGFYYSQAQDWHEKDGAGNTWGFSFASVYSRGNGSVLSGSWSSRVRPVLPFRLQNWPMITTLWSTVFVDMPDFFNSTT